MEPDLGPKSLSSCLSFLSAGITGMYHYSWKLLSLYRQLLRIVHENRITQYDFCVNILLGRRLMLRDWCAKHAFYHGAACLLHAPMFVYLAYFYVIHAIILISILFLLWVNNTQRHTTVHITSHPFVCPSISSWERCCYWHLCTKISSSTCVHFLKKIIRLILCVISI